MAFRIKAHPEGLDPREAKVKADAALRKIAINNLSRDAVIGDALRREKQMLAFPTAMALGSNAPNLQQIVTVEAEGANSDSFFIYQKALENLKGVCGSEDVANYIVDRLSPEEQAFMNRNFQGLARSLIKTTGTLSKDAFVEFIGNEYLRATNQPVLPFGTAALRDPTAQADQRAANQQAILDLQQQTIQADNATQQQKMVSQLKKNRNALVKESGFRGSDGNLYIVNPTNGYVGYL
jgi:hypothetical protein